MSLILLDSNVIIDVMRGVEDARSYLRTAIDVDQVWSVTPVRTELLAGVRAGEIDRLRALFDEIVWQDVTMSIADRAGKFAARYSRSHQIGLVDLVLAAAAIELGGVVATRNVRDFPMFPDLRPPY